MTTSPRDVPLASKLARRWFDERTYTVAGIPPAAVLRARKRASGARVSVGIPALNEAATIGAICRTISAELIEGARLVDELVVLDGGSTDDTAEVARAAGATVIDVTTVLPQMPAVGGKGESLWRSLAVLGGDIVVWIDADIRNFQSHFVSRLLAPLLVDETIDYVKAYYTRPIEHGGRLLPSGGGRVTELCARPMLTALFPELSGFLQPLSGEYAGRADALRAVPFMTGYSVEVALLIDLLEQVGLGGMAQVDLGTRVHRNRPLSDLGPMSAAIMSTIMRRAEERGRMRSALDYPSHPLLLPAGPSLRERWIEEMERPPLDLIPSYLQALGPAAVAL